MGRAFEARLDWTTGFLFVLRLDASLLCPNRVERPHSNHRFPACWLVRFCPVSNRGRAQSRQCARRCRASKGSAVRPWLAASERGLATEGESGRALDRLQPRRHRGESLRVGILRSTQSSRARRQWESLVAAVPNASAAETRPSPAGPLKSEQMAQSERIHHSPAASTHVCTRKNTRTHAFGSEGCTGDVAASCFQASSSVTGPIHANLISNRLPGLLETKRRMPRPKTILSPMLVPADALTSYLTDFDTSMQIVV